MKEGSDFVRSCAVRVVPNILVHGAEPVEAILDLNRSPVVGDVTLVLLVYPGCRRFLGKRVVENLSTDEHLRPCSLLRANRHSNFSNL